MSSKASSDTAHNCLQNMFEIKMVNKQNKYVIQPYNKLCLAGA